MDKKEVMSKATLIRYIAFKEGITLKEAKSIVNAVFDAITESLVRGEIAKISGFGSFRLNERKPRKGRNPSTGGIMEMPAINVISFRASADTKRRVNAK